MWGCGQDGVQVSIVRCAGVRVLWCVGALGCGVVFRGMSVVVWCDCRGVGIVVCRGEDCGYGRN
jgi:hypothetical protein